MICTAPAGNFVLSNGELRERAEPAGRARASAGTTRSTSRSRRTCVTLVCGPFVELTDRAPKTGVDVYYFCGAGTRGRRAPQLRAHAAR